MYAVKIARVDDVRREFAELHRRALVTPGIVSDGAFDYFEVPNATFYADRPTILATTPAPKTDDVVAWHRDLRRDGLGCVVFAKRYGYRFRSAADLLAARGVTEVPINLSDSIAATVLGLSRLVFSLRPSARGTGLALGLSVFVDQLSAGGGAFPFFRAWHLFVQERMLTRLRRTFPELTTEYVVFHAASVRIYRLDFEALAAMARSIFSDARPNPARGAEGE